MTGYVSPGKTVSPFNVAFKRSIYQSPMIIGLSRPADNHSLNRMPTTSAIKILQKYTAYRQVHTTSGGILIFIDQDWNVKQGWKIEGFRAAHNVTITAHAPGFEMVFEMFSLFAELVLQSFCQICV
jgi:hypothetical protein